MAQKEKLPRVTTPAGELRYYFLKGNGKTQFDPKGSLECEMVFTREQAEPLIAELTPLLDANFDAKFEELDSKKGAEKAKAKSLVKAGFYKPEYDEDGNETGRLVFKFKQKKVVARASDGKEFPQVVKHVTSSGKDFTPGEDFKPANGCKIRLNIEVAPYYIPKDNAVGLTLRPKVVKFITYIPYAGGIPSDMMGDEGEDEGFEYEESVPASAQAKQDNGDF